MKKIDLTFDELITKYLKCEVVYSDSILYNPSNNQIKLTKSLKKLTEKRFFDVINYGKARGLSEKEILKFIKDKS